MPGSSLLLILIPSFVIAKSNTKHKYLK